MVAEDAQNQAHARFSRAEKIRLYLVAAAAPADQMPRWFEPFGAKGERSVQARLPALSLHDVNRVRRLTEETSPSQQHLRQVASRRRYLEGEGELTGVQAFRESHPHTVQSSMAVVHHAARRESTCDCVQ
jgi:hypothetical protein